MLAWMIARFAIFPGFLFVMVVACGGATTLAAVPTPIPATLPAATATSTAIKRSTTQVKYQIISHYGGVFYCDPDFYP